MRSHLTAWLRAHGGLTASAVLLAGVPGAEVGEAGWLVALQLWFLPVYLLLAALTPALLAACRQWGLRASHRDADIHGDVR